MIWAAQSAPEDVVQMSRNLILTRRTDLQAICRQAYTTEPVVLRWPMHRLMVTVNMAEIDVEFVPINLDNDTDAKLK